MCKTFAICPCCHRPVDVETAVNTGLRVRGTRPAYFHVDCVGENKPRTAHNELKTGAAMAHGHEYQMKIAAPAAVDNAVLAAELLSDKWQAITGGYYQSPRLRNLKAHKKLRTAVDSINAEKVRFSVTVFSTLTGCDTAFLDSIAAFDGLRGVDATANNDGSITFKVRTRNFDGIANCYRFAQAVVKSIETKIDKYGYGYKAACAVLEWVSRRANEYGYNG